MAAFRYILDIQFLTFSMKICRLQIEGLSSPFSDIWLTA
jgi:hypothetical protein